MEGLHADEKKASSRSFPCPDAVAFPPTLAVGVPFDGADEGRVDFGNDAGVDSVGLAVLLHHQEHVTRDGGGGQEAILLCKGQQGVTGGGSWKGVGVLVRDVDDEIDEAGTPRVTLLVPCRPLDRLHPRAVVLAGSLPYPVHEQLGDGDDLCFHQSSFFRLEP